MVLVRSWKHDGVQGMHSLDPHGNYRAVELDASLDQPGEVPLGPARAARGKAAAVQEDDNG